MAEPCFAASTNRRNPALLLETQAAACVATGHNVWGMLNVTGEAMTELIAGNGEITVDLHAFDPGRMAALDPSAVRA